MLSLQKDVQMIVSGIQRYFRDKRYARLLRSLALAGRCEGLLLADVEFFSATKTTKLLLHGLKRALRPSKSLMPCGHLKQELQ